jgi:23S rRNA (cytidine1920-2'-O)/16S rRNA (cytidine1409-2'-O)-methyltransferase
MKKRLDQLVVERGLAPSRDAAKRLILAGCVRVDGELRDKAGRTYDETLAVELAGPRNPYVSRGGLKLAHALEAFGVEFAPGSVVLDIGASTGGFTDCVLQRGASRVVAVDSGRAQLHEKMRADPRVVVHEKTNARFLELKQVGGEPFPWIVIDVSFISLRLILPACARVIAPGGRVIALVKPQFEAGRREVASGGIVRDPEVHRRVLADMIDFCVQERWQVHGIEISPVRGSDGNVEFFMLLSRSSDRVPGEADSLVGENLERVLTQAAELQGGEN